MKIKAQRKVREKVQPSIHALLKMIKATKVKICEEKIGRKPNPLNSTFHGILLNHDRYWFDNILSPENLFCHGFFFFFLAKEMPT